MWSSELTGSAIVLVGWFLNFDNREDAVASYWDRLLQTSAREGPHSKGMYRSPEAYLQAWHSGVAGCKDVVLIDSLCGTVAP